MRLSTTPSLRTLSARPATWVAALLLSLLVHGCVDDGDQGMLATAEVAARDAERPAAEVLARPPSPPIGDVWPPAPVPLTGGSCSARLVGSGRTYDLGPGQPYTEAAAVPWLSLQAGDVVNVHHREQPYRVKIGLASQGRAGAPIVINGVTDADCNRPVFSGEDARIASDAAATGYFQTDGSERLGTILLHRRPTDAWGDRPAYITLRNLEITGASPLHRYTGQDGASRSYLPGAAGIHAVVVDHLTIENSVIHGNGNGIVVRSENAVDVSSNIVLRANAIFDNGRISSALGHNVDIHARRALYEGNYIGQLVSGAEGTSLMDRSSGTVVRYNRIDAAARAIDLSHSPDGVPALLNDPLYPDAWVYGNSIVNDLSTEARSSFQLVSWSGQPDSRYQRGGTLHWYHNTVQTLGDAPSSEVLSMFAAPQRGERILARNSVFVHEGEEAAYLVGARGRAELSGPNYLSEGWQASVAVEADVQVDPPIPVPGRALEPDISPTPGGPLVDAGDGVTSGGVAMIAARSAVPIDGSVWRIDHQPDAPWGLAPRTVDGDAPDVGAFEVVATP